MLRVREPVWHKQFKRGIVAYSMPGDVRVIFDDQSQNPLISTESPIHISLKDIESLSGEQKLELLDAAKRAKEQGAPLDGHVIEFPGGLNPEANTLTKYDYPLQDGYFQVIQVQQPFAGIKYEELPGKFRSRAPKGPVPEGKPKFYPAKDYVDLKIQNVETGRKYTVQLARKQYPSMYVARRVPEDSLAVLFDEGDLLWNTKPTEPESDEQQL